MNYHLYELKSFQETDKACLLLRLGCLFIIMSASFVFIISGVEVSKCPFSKQEFQHMGVFISTFMIFNPFTNLFSKK